MKKSVLVTGGAGYIGSHTVLQLVESGYDVVVLDNLYSGYEWTIPEQASFYQGDVGDVVLLDKIFSNHDIDAVIHFAGYTVVPESIIDPSKYYHNNVVSSLSLIKACIRHHVHHFVFSSSAAVYGDTTQSRVPESAILHPITPYGRTKLMIEWMLQDFSRVYPEFNHAVLRYFNVAGAHMGGKLGQSTPDATHLIKVACETAVGKRASMDMFGDDYDTPDGTCIRDFIHVDDLANAHLHAIDYLDQQQESSRRVSVVLNCGYGKGYSVQQVVDCIKQISNNDFVVNKKPRREGDLMQVVADNKKILNTFAWRPKYNDLSVICQSAYQWEVHHS